MTKVSPKLFPRWEIDTNSLADIGLRQIVRTLYSQSIFLINFIELSSLDYVDLKSRQPWIDRQSEWEKNTLEVRIFFPLRCAKLTALSLTFIYVHYFIKFS